MPFKVIKELSEQAKKNLDDMNIELQKTPFVKLKDGEKILLYFDPDKCKIVYKEFEGEEKKLYSFGVYDPNLDMDRTWDTANVKLVEQIVKHLKNKEFFLKIKRLGEGKNTTYDVEVAQE